MNGARHDLAARDAAARRAASRTFDRPIVLEAGAGTGKTAALVARVLTWALGPGWQRATRELAASPRHRREGTNAPPPAPAPAAIAARVLGRIVAITFTEKAAAEMAERIRADLTRVAAGNEVRGFEPEATEQSNGELAARAAALSAAFEHLHVSTIHAFCRRLLSAHALEARLHPAFTVDVDGSLVHQVVDEVIAGRLTSAYGDPGDDDFVALAARGRGPAELAQALFELAQAAVDPAALAEDPLSPSRVAAFRDALEAPLGALLQRTAGVFDGNRRIQKSAEAVRLLVDLRAALRAPGSEPPTASQLIDALAAAAGAESKLKDWAKGSFGKTEEQLLGAAAPAVQEHATALCPLLHARDPEQLELLRLAQRVLHGLYVQVAAILRSRGIATFDGLLQETERLLRTRPDVSAKVRAAIDQLLVDEFQDTDRVQCGIVRALALAHDAAAPGLPPPGLFLVGDPKQSIYGWRNADLAAYEQLVGEALAEGGERHSLHQNFRSVPAVLDEVAALMQPTMLAAPGLQPPFEPLYACPQKATAAGFTEGGRRPVEHWVSWAPPGAAGGGGADTPQDVARELEAAAIAADLAALHGAHGVRFGECALLLRTTTSQETYLRALRERDVPYTVERDRSYFRQREVVDAVATLRAIVDPNDQLALLTFVRSPLAGVPDAALLPLWKEQLPELAARLHGRNETIAALDNAITRTAAAVPSDVPGLEPSLPWPVTLRAALRALGELRRALHEEPADRFVALLRRLLLHEETAAARYLGAHRLANLERFFGRVLATLGSGRHTARDLLRELARSAEEERDREEGAPVDHTVDAVRVLTIHQAKGLQFAHVYLADTHGERRLDDGAGRSEVVVDADGQVELCLLGARGLGWQRIVQRRRSVAGAEAVRLLYVAATRAEERLVVTGKWSMARLPRDPLLAKSHAQLVVMSRHPALDPDAAIAAGAPHESLLPKLRLRVLCTPGAAAEPSAREQIEAPLAPQQAAAWAARFRELQEAATRREQRPLTAAAATAAEAALDPDVQVPMHTGVSTSTHDAMLARAIGIAVHRVLQDFDLAADVPAELQRQEARLPALLAHLLPPSRAAEALAAARDLLHAFRATPLPERLRALAPHVLARELPFVVPPPPNAEEGPLAATIGSIDLLYRDPATGAPTIADFKTDRVDAAHAAAYALRHRAQGRAYAVAVQRALRLPAPPRFEVWFLRAGCIVPVPLEGPAETPPQQPTP